MRVTGHGSAGWDPLGVTPDRHGGANVAIWAQGASSVDLCLFDELGREERIPLTERVFNVYHRHLDDLPAGTRYGFRVHGEWNPAVGHRWNPSKLLLDPYAKAIEGTFRLNPAVYGHLGSDDLTINSADSAPFVPKGVVVDDHFDWGDDESPGTAWGDTVIYETHVRGITKLHPSIPEHERGTYAGLTHPAVLEHLTTLGVTAIELLPVHHFVDEVHLLEDGLTNYWGYNSLGYFAPHAAYSSTGARGGQVSEFKRMVKAMHAAGLEVILDVVYNHTAEGNQLGPTLSFRGIDNDDYYHLRDGGRFYADYTGCGNTLDVSKAHVLQLVMDSLRYWVEEMHVDGFRFDLASALARVVPRRQHARQLHDDDPAGPRPAPRQAHRRALGRRTRRVPGRRVPAAVDRVERQVPRQHPRLLARGRRHRGTRLAPVRLGRPVRLRGAPSVRVHQLRHGARRLHAARPRHATSTSTTRRTSRATATAPTTTGPRTTASRARPPTRRSTTSGGGSSATCSRPSCCPPASR